MSTVAVVVIVIVAVLVIAGAGYLAWRQQQRRRLRERFGPEYDRTVERHSSTREAEQELRAREQRHDELPIRPLGPQVRDRYRADWQRLQEKFVDSPETAVTEADNLLIRVMNERGYPTDDDFEQRVADLSVEHAATIDRYRKAHDVRGRAETKQASTEDLRQAMVHYRALFADLLGDGNADGGPDTAQADTTRADASRADADTTAGRAAPAGAAGPAGTGRVTADRVDRAAADREDEDPADITDDGRNAAARPEAGDGGDTAAQTGRPDRRAQTAATDAAADDDRAASDRAVAGREADLSKGRRR